MILKPCSPQSIEVEFYLQGPGRNSVASEGNRRRHGGKCVCRHARRPPALCAALGEADNAIEGPQDEEQGGAVDKVGESTFYDN